MILESLLFPSRYFHLAHMEYKSESVLHIGIAPVSFYVAKELYSMFPVSNFDNIFRLLSKERKEKCDDLTFSAAMSSHPCS